MHVIYSTLITIIIKDYATLTVFQILILIQQLHSIIPVKIVILLVKPVILLEMVIAFLV